MKASPNNIRKQIRTFLSFISRDIWRISEHEVGGLRHRIYNIIRTIILASKGFSNNELVTKASSLTFFSLFALVPLLGLILGIAKGFGFQQLIETQLIRSMPGHTEVLDFLFSFVESILEVAGSGVIVGVGILFIIFSVWAILNNIEISFNKIWQIPKSRGFLRKITDYMALLLIIPILLIISSGASIFLNTMMEKSSILAAVSPLVNFLMKLSPFFISWLLFTLLYILAPNTKVRFKNAAISGLIVGTAFQIFQSLYIGGQLWVNRYNAIYGSFAAFPLLLLWLQLAWIMVLYGAEITFASQNIRNFFFEKEIKNISDRYSYFSTLMITGIICKRFENREAPLTAVEISSLYHIPSRLTQRILNLLIEMKIINQTISDEDKRVITYQPAMDINQITVGMILKSMFDFGTEDFKMDIQGRFRRHWNVMLDIEKELEQKGDKVLVKDL
ncbi:MAG: YihY/virulence factor BrkB family protein [Bacteroidales bacterium]|jgi:membrane protein|nr:YihY/virulence factor BrkB family protein [Bacteroidales bacterium]MDD2559848.1 YihY/virulence factor BrkB family protein [Bacteroidales bacterium]MDD2618400.1 YihY/virulence factor BrkB family protein [Bacteroidales bacterium]NLB03317.1 YihY/virulence factor BrkB family protein [Bacteroidales bacterium]